MQNRDTAKLTEAIDILQDAVGAILQLNKKAKGKIFEALLAKGGGLAATKGVVGLVSTFGTASTGTTIGSLSGAAASNASLYWIGSIVGGGVATGTFILGIIAVAAALIGARYWRGKKRSEGDLDEHEKRILKTIEIIIPHLHQDINNSQRLDKEYATSFLSLWQDLIHHIDRYLKNNAQDRLVFLHRFRLYRVYDRMKKLKNNFESLQDD